MKLRDSKNIDRSNSLGLRSRSFTRLPNQKAQHMKVKQGSQVIDSSEETPLCASLFLHRRSSFSNPSSIGSTVTPLTYNKNFSFSHRSNGSSGYCTIHKSKSIRSKKDSVLITRSVRRLNITALSICPLEPKIVITSRALQPPKISRTLANLSTVNSTNKLSCEFLKHMIDKEAIYLRDPTYFNRQAYINPQMRSVLIEWLKEVCDAYTLNTETFFLAVDYMDRYLSAVDDIQIHSFQAIGTTCLFIASKLSEIRPPRIDSFANVTDGASNSAEILLHEGHILLKINWHLQPITAYSWLKLFLQISKTQNYSTQGVDYQGPLTRHRYIQSFEKSYLSRDFLISSCSSSEAVYVDLLISCLRDVSSLRFPYAVIAASIISLISITNVLNITGYRSDEISMCKKWLRQFYFPVQPPLKESTVHNMEDPCKMIKIEKAYSNLSINRISNEKEKENIQPVNC